MRYLALDVGRKHTGVAYADDVLGIPTPLDTIHHSDEHELVAEVLHLVSTRGIDVIIVGNPLLLSGTETDQTHYSQSVGILLKEACPQCEVTMMDERWTGGDHARAALKLLTIYLERGVGR